MTGMAAIGGAAAGTAVQGLIDRHDLVATLDRAAAKRVTIISAPAGSGKTSLLHTWAGRPAQDHAQLFWLALPGTVRAAAGSAESPPAAPEFNGQAMVDKVLTELAASGGPSVLITDDLHQLSSGYGENARAGVKAHLDTVTERGRV